MTEASVELAEISVGNVAIGKDNPRTVNTSSEAFRDLVGSVAAGGVRIPVHVRALSATDGTFALLAGERRVLAAREAGVATVPAVVHRGMTAQEAFDLTFTENSQREDLTPLEEAKAVAILLERFKGDAAAVASKMGKSRKWVRLRAHLHRNLDPLWAKRYTKKDAELAGWTAGHLELIARLPRETQRALAKKWGQWGLNYWTVGDLARRLADHERLLAKAPWNLADDTLVPRVGACSSCKKRSNCQPGLWGDEEGTVIEKNDRCLDGRCWRAKQDAYVCAQATALREKHPDLVLMRGKNEDHQNDPPDLPGAVYSPWNVTSAKKGTTGAVPALVISGPKAGTLRHIRVLAKPSARRTGPTPLAERRKKLELKRWSEALGELRDALRKAPDFTCNDLTERIATIATMAAVYGVDAHVDAHMCNWGEVKLIVADGEEYAVLALWEAVRDSLARDLRVDKDTTPDRLKHVLGEARQIAALVKVDVDAVYADVSTRKGFTEPKSWARLNADGTPKGGKGSASGGDA